MFASPIPGKVNLLEYWSDHQYAKTDQPLMIITPLQKSKAQVVKVRLPIRGAGKVKNGQKVWLSLHDYPEQEYGKIEGEIIHISELTTSDANTSEESPQYVIDVKLSNSLHTYRGKTLHFKPEMLGEASIITEPYSLLDRIVNPLLKITKGT